MTRRSDVPKPNRNPDHNNEIHLSLLTHQPVRTALCMYTVAA